MEKVETTKAETTKRVVGQKMYYNDQDEFILKQSIDLNFPVLLVGDTGCGKTSFIRNVALERGINLIRLNLSGQTGVDEILGKWLVRSNEETRTNEMYWVDGLLIKAMKDGDFIVFDEINMALPEILSVLHSLLDDDRSIVLKEKDGSKIEPHPRFRFFATMNDCDEYAGTKELNKAFVSRFPVILNINYSEFEDKILCERTGIKLDDAQRLILAANEVRKHKKQGNLSYICSTRDLLYCSDLMMKKFKPGKALEVSILNKVSYDERDKVAEIFKLVTGKNIKIQTKNSGVMEFKTFEDIKRVIDNALGKEKKSVEEKVIIRDRLKNLENTVIKLKENMNEKETKLMELVGIEKKRSDLIKDRVSKLLTSCKIPKKDIDAIFSSK